MKRLLPILLAIPLLGAGPEGEWKVVKGEWKQPTKTSWQGTAGTIRFGDGATGAERIRFTANIIILDWTNPTSYFVILWGAEDNRQSLRVTPTAFRVGPWGLGPESCARTAWKAPTTKRIELALDIKPQEVVGSLAGQKVKASYPPTTLLPIEIRTEGVNLVLDNLSLR